eukprot:2889730-Amphidinium_carterae.1
MPRESSMIEGSSDIGLSEDARHEMLHQGELVSIGIEEDDSAPRPSTKAVAKCRAPKLHKSDRSQAFSYHSPTSLFLLSAEKVGQDGHKSVASRVSTLAFLAAVFAGGTSQDDGHLEGQVVLSGSLSTLLAASASLSIAVA